jgi:hypothetical protein
MVLAIKIISVFLGTTAVAIMLAALGLTIGVLPDSGYGGVILVDSVFGTLVLLTAARLMWLSAIKKERRENEAE